MHSWVRGPLVSIDYYGWPRVNTGCHRGHVLLDTVTTLETVDHETFFTSVTTTSEQEKPMSCVRCLRDQ